MEGYDVVYYKNLCRLSMERQVTNFVIYDLDA